MSFPAQINLRLWILEEDTFGNKNKNLMFILTGEQQHQAKTFFHHTDTLPSQYYNNEMGEHLCGEKTFRSGTDVPLAERRSKLENNWESISNFKLWPLNTSRDFLTCFSIQMYQKSDRLKQP